jgi:hypothetical protein
LDPEKMAWQKEAKRENRKTGVLTQISEERLNAQELARKAISERKLSVDTVSAKASDLFAEASEIEREAQKDIAKLMLEGSKPTKGRRKPRIPAVMEEGVNDLFDLLKAARSGELAEGVMLPADAPPAQMLAKHASDLMLYWWLREKDTGIEMAKSKYLEFYRVLIADMSVEQLAKTFKENLKDRHSQFAGNISDAAALYAAHITRGEVAEAEELARKHADVERNRMKYAISDAVLNDSFYIITKEHRERVDKDRARTST